MKPIIIEYIQNCVLLVRDPVSKNIYSFYQVNYLGDIPELLNILKYKYIENNMLFGVNFLSVDNLFLKYMSGLGFDFISLVLREEGVIL